MCRNPHEITLQRCQVQLYLPPRACCAPAADLFFGRPRGPQILIKSTCARFVLKGAGASASKHEKTHLWKPKGAKRCQNEGHFHYFLSSLGDSWTYGFCTTLQQFSDISGFGGVPKTSFFDVFSQVSFERGPGCFLEGFLVFWGPPWDLLGLPLRLWASPGHVNKRAFL